MNTQTRPRYQITSPTGQQYSASDCYLEPVVLGVFQAHAHDDRILAALNAVAALREGQTVTHKGWSVAPAPNVESQI